MDRKLLKMAISTLSSKIVRNQFTSLIIPASNLVYKVNTSLNGTYQMSCASTTVLTIFTDLDPETSFSTTSGIGTFSTAFIPYFFVRINTGTNIAVLFTKVSDITNSRVSGTIDSVTTTSTYTGTGEARVLVIGGGQGGNPSTSPSPGKGGDSGAAKVLYYQSLPGNVPVVIGAGGPAGTAGGATTFGGISSAGGTAFSGGASGDSPSGPQGTGNGGTPGNPILLPFGANLSGSGGYGGQMGFAGGWDSIPGRGGGGGGLLSGGGSGGSWLVSHSGQRGAGGGGGGFSAGSGGSRGIATQPQSTPVPGAGGAGGAGGVYVLRFT